MNLLTFRTPAFYAACHRCGNALTRGEEECPHCGTNQSRAVCAPNSVDSNNGSAMLMPGRMFVPYPSVPEEVDAAMNIARVRARVVRRVAFGVAGGGLLAVALALTYAPSLRSPVVQRLAALPEPARTPAFVPVATENAPKAAAPTSATTIAAAAKPPMPISVSAPAPPAVTLAAPPAVTLAAPPPVTVAAPPPVTVAAPPPVTVAAPPAVTLAAPPALAQTPTEAAPPALSQASALATTLATATNRATEMITSIAAKFTSAAVAVRAEISTLAISLTAGPVTTTTSIAPPPATAPTATAATTATTRANEPIARRVFPAPEPKSPTAGPGATVAQGPVVAPAAVRSPPPAPVMLAQNTAATPPSTTATTAATTTTGPSQALTISTPPAPSPSAVADVPIASHAPQPSAPVEQELPKLSLPPVLPVIATERPPVGSPGESVYFARLALAINDLSAAQKNLANVPADQLDSPGVKQVRDDLAQREAARDTAMQHARTCDRSASWRCARRYAKDALAIDSSYADSRVFLKHVYIKIAEAKKAAQIAQIQNAAIAERGPLHPAPIREAVVITRVVPVTSTPSVPRSAPVASTASVPSTTGSAPRLFANPIARAPRETHVVHEAHEARVATEMGEPVVAFQPVRNADTVSAWSKAPDDATPIRPAGRGEAH